MTAALWTGAIAVLVLGVAGIAIAVAAILGANRQSTRATLVVAWSIVTIIVAISVVLIRVGIALATAAVLHG